MTSEEPATEEQVFVLFRRKVRAAEVLSSSVERLLRALHFTGRLSVVVQNGRVLKSGYEEGYFIRRNQLGSTSPESQWVGTESATERDLLTTTNK